MTNYSLWRLPGQNHYTLMQQTKGRPVQLDSPEQLDGRSGFVLAPFSPDESTPILLMQPDKVELHPIPESSVPLLAQVCKPVAVDEAYARCFARSHEAILRGQFGKLVLSHRQQIRMKEFPDPKALFLSACRLYPRQFVALISMEVSGTWLMASPEVLVEGRDVDMRTMSLAGTMPAPEEGQEVAWDEKNRAEQALVTKYIIGRLKTCARDIGFTQPYTARAAHLVHLRTDIRFRLDDCSRLGRLLQTLHPTPAVCGFPTHAARQWIQEHEAHSRGYYSGFCGVLAPSSHTHLHVSLRCMQLQGLTATLYAGGGLMPGSRLESEWMEVQQKMQTMRNLL